MMAMTTREVTVTDWKGRPAPALLATCSCGGETFRVFQVFVGVRGHLHLQCTNCDVTMCDGTCSNREVDDATVS